MIQADAPALEEIVVLHSAEMQFRGQTHLIRVALPRADMALADIQKAFEGAYFARFRVELPEIRAVLVNLLTTVIGRRPSFPLSALLDPDARQGGIDAARVGERALYADGAWHQATVWQRERLPEGATIIGPAIIQQADATTVLEPGSRAIVDAIGNLRVTP
jgi:N-methylhydantoinase A